MNLIHEAIIFATLKHNASDSPIRKGTKIPYITHPMEVMQILSANNCSEKVIVAGILHDTLEDTFTKPEEISEKFGREVLEIVQSESEDKNKTWDERKQATIDHLKTASLETKLVCCADKLANVRSMASDKAVVGDQLWKRFNAPKERIRWYYMGVSSALTGLDNYPMYKELNALINEVFK
jgi:GTP diphosphokinase / guanosine-3',5'-bis(diphosphate) 3'-diphosphatase